MGDESFRKRVGILIGVLAVILAITETAGNAAMKETINSNIEASNNFAFYQARNIRQTDTRLAADQLDMLAMSRPDLPEASGGRPARQGRGISQDGRSLGKRSQDR